RLDTAAPEGILVAEAFDEAAKARLRAGGKVLLLARPESVNAEAVVGFSSVFWNTAWTRNQPPHTLGILCDPRHPVFAHFPTESHSNWQWWEPIHGAAAMVLEGMPPNLRPLVQPIDTWFEARRLALLFEARVWGGKLMVSSMDLSKDLDRRIVARQLRYSILRYMEGDRFDPKVEVGVDQLQSLFKGGASSGR
ncbi:MAG: glycoside hydrolase, partial [Planctomycetota bacterium]